MISTPHTEGMIGMTSSNESLHGKSPILERLISHFVASKKSLVAISHVQRANDVVASARASLETIASLNARNLFCREAINRQMHMVSALQQSLGNVLSEGKEEFRVC